ncbi:MAG: epoxyqueuosine reductase [Coriobacteriia bacterium]|nr:epoxyqueuosine reductase [Coriobacteriia bacterium]MCL2750593.1 epoxyqueuosine reductase [Coriobacteriia bacterium]
MTVNDMVLDYLASHNIEIVGFADLSVLPAEQRENFPFGISIGIPYSRESMLDNINDKPKASWDEYNKHNQRMAEAAIGLAGELAALGYKASAKPQYSIMYNSDLRSLLPFKTVAGLAGLGWIGKCALFVTENYGSALRLAMVLTTAPLNCGKPLTASRCESTCMTCRDMCPAQAPSGKLWEPGMDRAEFFDAAACNQAARQRAQTLLSIDHTVCALCMSHCPFTRRAFDY